MKVQFKELDYILLNEDEKTEIKEIPDEEVQFGRSVLHSCLIYLGDLSRYQAEIYHMFDPSFAARYYLQAAHIDMTSGMPYNQLGNLYLDKNYNLDSVCYYIHCLNCISPFDGAMGNLNKIFEKNTQFCETLNDPDTLTQTEHIQNTVAKFLSLIEIWYLNKNDTNIPQRCNIIAQELKIAMDFNMSPLPDINKNYDEYTQAIEEENINPSYLNGGLVHKVVQICLFTITKMNEIDEQKAFACKAFTLALFSQLLQKLLKQLESFGLQNPAHNYKPRQIVQDSETETILEPTEPVYETKELLTSFTNGLTKTENQEEILSKDNLSDNESKKLNNADVKNAAKKSLAKRRRRRRTASSESSLSDADTESSEIETDASCSDEEELSDSSYQSEDNTKSDDESVHDGSDGEATTEKLNGDASKKIDKQIKNSAKPETNENGQAKAVNKDIVLNATEIQKFLQGDNFLASIKLLQDWVLTEKDLIVSCGDSGESLFQCVVDLLNIFSYYFKNNENTLYKDCQILEYAKMLAKNLKLEYKTIPLAEDLNLRGTNICKFDKDAAEWQILNWYKPTAYEENVIRILNFIDFGNQISKIVPRIRYNRNMKIFYLKKHQHPKLNTKINHKRSREWHNSKKQHVSS